jgi:hypothetical protein
MSTCFCKAADGKGKFLSWLVVIGILGVNVFLHIKAIPLKCFIVSKILRYFYPLPLVMVILIFQFSTTMG